MDIQPGLGAKGNNGELRVPRGTADVTLHGDCDREAADGLDRDLAHRRKGCSRRLTAARRPATRVIVAAHAARGLESNGEDDTTARGNPSQSAREAGGARRDRKDKRKKPRER